MRFDILTIFPEMFASIAGSSILKRALENGGVELVLHDIRQYAHDRHRTVDDAPYGGGAGMLLKAEPIVEAVKGVENTGGTRLCVFLTPQGKKYTQEDARRLMKYNQLLLICGHYEGVDQRVRDKVVDEELSIGDYVLTGGEIPAAVITDSIARLIEGVLGNSKSHEEESFEKGLLEHPHYTRPANIDGMKVPEVLLSGKHKDIEEWRRSESVKKTKKVRPDLIN